MQEYKVLKELYEFRHTWFDRDLGIAGRVMVQQEDGSYKHTLVHIKK
jgi:aspartyl aminopeptidase